MEQKERNESSRYDGIMLMVISAVVTALILAGGCGRNNDFAKATALAMSATEDMAPQTRPRPVQTVTATPVATKAAASVADTVPIKPGARYHDRIHINPIGRLREVFNDSNKYQYAVAEQLGLRPISDIGHSYFTSRPIVHVVSNKYYTVDSLKHSLPYLVPEAEAVLRDIGKNFIDSLHRRGADSYRIMVTSLLRTPQTVRRLRRVNRNAVDSSTHQFGTTFDISFTRFHNLDSTRTIHEEDLKNLLAEVLYDMRNNRRCLVKYEHRGGCFHITARR